MSNNSHAFITIAIAGLDENTVYRAFRDGELMSAHVVKAEAHRLMQTGFVTASAFLAQLEPASEEEAAAYHAGLVVTVEELRKELQAQIEKLTGCTATINVNIHSSAPGCYPLFAAAANVTEAAKSGYNGSQWYKLGNGRNGETTIFGPGLAEATK